MKKFKYLISANEGIHARPATIIVNNAKQFNSKIIVTKQNNKADCKRIIALMSLNAKKGDLLEIEIDGTDEMEAMESLQKVFKEIL